MPLFEVTAYLHENSVPRVYVTVDAASKEEAFSKVKDWEHEGDICYGKRYCSDQESWVDEEDWEANEVTERQV